MSLLRDIAAAPSTSDSVQNVLLESFTALRSIVGATAVQDSRTHMGDNHDGEPPKHTRAILKAHKAKHSLMGSLSAKKMLPTLLAPILVVGGALDALFLRATTSPRVLAEHAPAMLRDDVMDAFLEACDCVLRSDWRDMCMLGEMMRARVTKALWELLASQVCMSLCARVREPYACMLRHLRDFLVILVLDWLPKNKSKLTPKKIKQGSCNTSRQVVCVWISLCVCAFPYFACTAHSVYTQTSCATRRPPFHTSTSTLH